MCFKFLSVNAVVENRQDLQECFSFRVMGAAVTSPFYVYSGYMSPPISAGSPRARVSPISGAARPHHRCHRASQDPSSQATLRQ